MLVRHRTCLLRCLTNKNLLQLSQLQFLLMAELSMADSHLQLNQISMFHGNWAVNDGTINHKR